MTVKVGINGFGRIGRNVLRCAIERGEFEVALVNHKSRRLDFKAINDLTYAQTLAHLLKYDSVHGILNADISATEDTIIINGKEIRVYAEGDPTKLPWKELGVDIVIESTGRFTKGPDAAKHIEAGAKKVIISAPGKDVDATIVMGVNDDIYDPANHNIISNASCTTNCLAPVAKVINDKFGIVKGLMTTVHSYTNDQQILDLPHKDLRRARAAGMSIIPTTTGAAKAVALVLPELNGKLNGFAMRVPTPNVSVVDLVVELAKPSSAEEINAALKEAADGPMKNILEFNPLPLVSKDFNGNPHSSIVDGLSTMVIDGNMAKVVAWYDNEWGYSNRVLDLALMAAEKGL
ncbi:type I glyceraldehyde-3-phosphate dehydrogenase [Desulforamulus aquiferis]|uniref:Glyceraldehyde-3-phosphate dehydrogenase n=1 Tax=Desulforamulus aquiferis TaxID=1397668 RepID=A0AAW7ZF91_9FIRM|nr:type I glyceraldehyde-3-phosphate dehydrogenase [Desulforamulus aquiferis]MDO7787915.1 type I glyceraldehyde-3-phosphate dehydrogenase [Desulforamulus aquiferis]